MLEGLSRLSGSGSCKLRFEGLYAEILRGSLIKAPLVLCAKIVASPWLKFKGFGVWSYRFLNLSSS